MSFKFASPTVAQNTTTEFIKLLPTISDAGWGGYITLSNLSFIATLGAPNISLADANATIFPFFQYIIESTGNFGTQLMVSYNSFYEFYSVYFSDDNGQAGIPAEIASRLLPRSVVETDPEKAAKIMLSLDGGVTLK